MKTNYVVKYMSQCQFSDIQLMCCKYLLSFILTNLLLVNSFTLGLIIGYLLCLQVNWFIDICQVFVVPFSQWPTFNVNTRSPNKQSDYLIPSYCTCAFTCSHTYKKGVVVYTHFIINLQPYVLTPVLLWERSTICIATNIHTSIDITWHSEVKPT